MYIINRKEDYADEFYYTVRSFLTSEQRTIFLENIDFIKEIINEESCMEFYFGTNEFLEFFMDDIIDMVTDAVQITDEEYKTLQKFSCASLDIIYKFMNRFIDKAYDLFDVENATEEQNKNMQNCEELYRIIAKGK